MSTNPGTPQRRSASLKWALIALALVLVVSAVVVIGILRRDQGKTTTSPTPAPSTASATSSVTQPDGPNGCVGGSDPTLAISSAFAEPLTERGAVEFTGTFFRWLFDSKTTDSQRDTLGPRIADKSALAPLKGGYDLSAGSHVGYSTKNSMAWVKSFDGRKGTATVVFSGKTVASSGTDAYETEMTSVVELVKKEDHWFVKKTSQGSYGKGEQGYERMMSDLTKHGTPLAGGCGA